MRILGYFIFLMVVGSAAADKPTVAEVSQKNSTFLQSGETEAKLQALRKTRFPQRNENERRENEVMEELTNEISTVFQELKDIDLTLADPNFLDFTKFGNVKEIDRKIHILVRAKEFNQKILTEAYWENFLREKLKRKSIPADRIELIVSPFLKGMREGLQRRTKQLGLQTNAEIEAYRQAIVSEHSISIEILKLLRQEFGKWKVVGDTMDFSRPEAAKRYAELYQKLEALPK